MTTLDEAVKRLEQHAILSEDTRPLVGTDIRTVLAALSQTQAELSDAFRTDIPSPRGQRDEARERVEADLKDGGGRSRRLSPE